MTEQDNSEQGRRRTWSERLKFWCQRAETSPKAAEVEDMAAKEGFEGENLKRQEGLRNSTPPRKKLNIKKPIKNK